MHCHVETALARRLGGEPHPGRPGDPECTHGADPPLDIGAWDPRGKEFLALGNLVCLRASCVALPGEVLEALGACRRLRSLDLGFGPVGDADYARLPALPLLEELHLGRGEGTGAAVATLPRFAGLRCVGLGDRTLDGGAIAALARLPRLEHLHDFRYPEEEGELADLHRLGGLRILDGYPAPGPRALPHVARLARLEELDLDGTGAPEGAGDGDLAAIAGLRELRCLVLRNTRITDAGLPHLAGLRGLEAIDLSLTPVTDAGLACLAGRGNLRWLGLDRCAGVTGRGLAHLPADSALSFVAAAASGIDEAGLAVLAALPALRWTNLNRTAIPPAALEAFLRARGDSLLYGDSVARG